MKFLTKEEIDRLLNSAESIRDRLMFTLAFEHGLRATEVCEIKLDDIIGDWITVHRLKGSRKTTQPLKPETIKLLAEWAKERRALLQSRGYDSSFLFISQKNGKVSRSQFFRIFKKAAEKAGIPPDKRHPHVMKHSLGRAMVSRGVSLPVIQKVLGHRSIASTGVYVEATDDEANEALRQI